MKQYGITRDVDTLGRVVIPKTMRKELGLETGDKISVYREGNRIIMEKSTAYGITRDVDTLGRVVIPKTMRKELGLETGDKISVYREENRIIMEKYTPFCVFCGSEEDVVDFAGKKVCTACIEKIKQL